MKRCKMKGKFFAVMMAVLVVAAAGFSVFASTIAYYHVLNATLITQEPDPAGPGEIIELKFRIENKGQSVAQDVEVELLTEYPFSLRPGDDAIKSIGSIEGYQDKEDGAVVKYKVMVDKNSPDGTHEIGLRMRSNKESWAVLDPFHVRVQNKIAILSITKVVSIPTMIAPGDKAKVAIELKNYASSLLKDVVVKLDVTGTSLNPIGSSNEKVIPSIDPQKVAIAEFDLMASPDASAGIVKVPAGISYSDITGKNYSKIQTISIIIGDTPDISVGLDRSDIYSKGDVGSVVFRVVNKGTTDVKFLSLKLGKMENVEIVGSDESYIGNLDSDDFSTAEFNLYVKSAAKEVLLPVTVEYKDANNNNYKKEVSLPLRIYSASEAKKIKKESNASALWIAIPIVLAAGFFLYRRWRRKKDQHH